MPGQGREGRLKEEDDYWFSILMGSTDHPGHISFSFIWVSPIDFQIEPRSARQVMRGELIPSMEIDNSPKSNPTKYITYSLTKDWTTITYIWCSKLVLFIFNDPLITYFKNWSWVAGAGLLIDPDWGSTPGDSEGLASSLPSIEPIPRSD